MEAFGGIAVPWHLTTREVVQEVRRVLGVNGIYLVNAIDYWPPRASGSCPSATTTPRPTS